ncbi:MAG: molybdopterin molybdotransferase MoeA [Candidatus Bathyarchaeota archaeon]|nr:molybdopterin molybdotransferase MoeA [Candidatus Termiticorpusculum sp.]MCL1970264.1 molybdopterin molybdotransferase MoeA [Candidatus Termiticorpusculum sp.]
MVKLQGFQKLTSVDEALKAWLTAWSTREPQQVLLPLTADVSGRVLAEDIIAQADLPCFDRSAMDGYAVRYNDSICASPSNVVKLTVVETDEIDAGQAKQVWTGNPIPNGADAVVMIENTEREGNTVTIRNALTPYLNVIRHGEDVKKGQLVAKKGTRLNPYNTGLAAALGYSALKVYQKPLIALLATGNEIVAIGAQADRHQIFDSNKLMLTAMCQELGAEVVDFGIVKDNTDDIAEKIRQALKTADALITTGGTSVGGLDLVPDAVNKAGKPGVIAHGIALRPAMPTGVAVLNDKPVMILSGNPVASIIGFEVFGRPAICKLLGLNEPERRPILKATLTRKISGVLGRKTYVRVLVKFGMNELTVEPVSAKGPGSISTMTQSNGYIIIPENCEGLREGKTVLVQMFNNIEA